MNNLEAVLKKFFGVLTKNYEDSNFNILEEISSDRDLFYNLKYCIEEEYVELFCSEIREFEGTEKYDNVVFNLVKLYPFTEKILKELMKNGNTSDNNEYYSIRKEELDKEIKGIKEGVAGTEDEEVEGAEQANECLIRGIQGLLSVKQR